MSEAKPTFTDVSGRKIHATIVQQNDFPYLQIAEVAADGSESEILLLNMYDAKKLGTACEQFLAQTIATNFSNMNGQLTPVDRVDIFDDDTE